MTSTLIDLPSDALSAVLVALGPPWATTDSSSRHGQGSRAVQALRLTSKSMQHAVDTCELYWSLANQSVWGGAPVVGAASMQPVDSSSCIQLQQWHAAHTAACKFQAIPSRAATGHWPLSSEAPATPGLCLTGLQVGCPCQRAHRPITAAMAVGKQLQWLHWGACACNEQSLTAGSAACVTPAGSCFTAASDSNMQGHTAAVTAFMAVPNVLHGWPCAGWVSSSADHTIKLWADHSGAAASRQATGSRGAEDVQQAVKAVKPVRTLRHHDEMVTCLELVTRPQGQQVLLASGSADKTICLSSLAPLVSYASTDSSRSNPKLCVLRGHDKRVTCLLSPSSHSGRSAPTTSHPALHLLLSGGLDGRVKVWDLTRGGSSLTLSSSPACVRGWKLDDPCKQLLSVWEPDSSCHGFSSPSIVAAVLSSGVYLLDARQDMPATCVCRYPRCRAQLQWTLLQAATAGGQLAVAHSKVVEVHDLRKLGGSLSLRSPPRLRLTAQPARPLTTLHMDRYKIVAAALPVGSKKGQQMHLDGCEQPGPVYCWSVQDGQLLNSFCPAAMPTIQNVEQSGTQTMASPIITHEYEGSSIACSFVPYMWPPCSTGYTTASNAAQVFEPNRQLLHEKPHSAAAHGNPPCAHRVPDRKAAQGVSAASAAAEEDGDSETDSDSGWSSSEEERERECEKPVHDPVRCMVHGMAVQGSHVFSVTTCTQPGTHMGSPHTQNSSSSCAVQLLDFAGPGVLMQNGGAGVAGELLYTVSGSGGKAASSGAAGTLNLEPGTDSVAIDATSSRFWAAV